MPTAPPRDPGSSPLRDRSRRRRRSRARRALGWAALLAVLAAVFVSGLAIGRAVEDAPRPGGTQTLVRTLEPHTVEPEERTVTASTTGR